MITTKQPQAVSFLTIFVEEQRLEQKTQEKYGLGVFIGPEAAKNEFGRLLNITTNFPLSNRYPRGAPKNVKD